MRLYYKIIKGTSDLALDIMEKDFRILMKPDHGNMPFATDEAISINTNEVRDADLLLTLSQLKNKWKEAGIETAIINKKGFLISWANQRKEHPEDVLKEFGIRL